MVEDVQRPARGARARLMTDGFELLEVSAPTPGAALIAAGVWLNDRHGTPEERIVESIGWHIPVERSDSYTAALTLTHGGRNTNTAER